MGAIKLWVRHNTFMRISMKVITQHILVMMTLHMKLTFTIHVRTAQCACVSKLSTDVVITKHSLVDQKYCPDVSKWKSQHIHGDCISSAITHTALLCNPSHQADGYVHMTPWEGHTRLIGSDVISYKGTTHFYP